MQCSSVQLCVAEGGICTDLVLGECQWEDIFSAGDSCVLQKEGSVKTWCWVSVNGNISLVGVTVGCCRLGDCHSDIRERDLQLKILRWQKI